jgi:amidase
MRTVLADDVAFWSTTRQAAAVRAREFSAHALFELYTARIERLNTAINAIVTLDLDRASRDAATIDERLARGEDVGSLAGIPMTIKDAIAVAGMRSTCGAIELQDHIPSEDVPAVAALRAAGAVIVGKTNVPRWCNAETETHNELFGTTNNPWDLSRSVGGSSGGSSGGSAAAVAAGLSSCDRGTDVGGSVRIPSHYRGTYALKPSFGVVPQLGYLSHVGAGRVDADMNVFGPVTRSANDYSNAPPTRCAPRAPTSKHRIRVSASASKSTFGWRSRDLRRRRAFPPTSKPPRAERTCDGCEITNDGKCYATVGAPGSTTTTPCCARSCCRSRRSMISTEIRSRARSTSTASRATS